MWRLSGFSTEDMPEERSKSSEKAGLCLNSVRKSALIYITVSNVLQCQEGTELFTECGRFSFEKLESSGY